MQVRHWADIAAASGQLLAQTLFARRPGVHVMHITSEMVPVAKARALTCAYVLPGPVAQLLFSAAVVGQVCWHDCVLTFTAVLPLPAKPRCVLTCATVLIRWLKAARKYPQLLLRCCVVDLLTCAGWWSG